MMRATIGWLLIAGTALAGAEIREIEFNRSRMTEVDTPFFNVTVNPLGGRLQRIFYKPGKMELTNPDAGSGTENVWNVGKSRFFLREKPFHLTPRQDRGECSVSASGNHAGGGINFLKVEKNYRFPENAAKIGIDYSFENIPAAMAPLAYGFWIHHSLGVLNGKCTYFYPTENGIAAIAPEKRGSEIWQFRPARGWIAAVSDDGRGVAVTMGYPELKCHYSWFSGMKVPTTEWRLESMNINAGKAFRTQVEILPFVGLSRVSGAGNGLVGELAAVSEAEGNAKVPVEVKVHSAAAGKVDAELYVRRAPDGKWTSVGKSEMLFSKPAEVRSFKCEVSAPDDTLLEMETVLRSGKRELARLNGFVNFGDSDEKWTLAPTESRILAAQNQVDLLRFNKVTPSQHIPWARPLPGKKLKTLILVQYNNIPEASQLAQRLDMEFTAPFLLMSGVYKSSPLYLLGDYFGMLSDSDISGNLDRALKGKYDAVLIGGLPWSYFSAKQRKTILDMVRSGTGLVYVGAGAADGSFMPFGHEGKKPKTTAAVPERKIDHPATSGIPFELLGKEPVYRGVATGGRVLAEAVKNPYLIEAELGKGKMMFLNYEATFGRFRASAGLTPNLKSEYPDRGVPFELYYSLLTKCVLAACGRAPEVALRPDFLADKARFRVDSPRPEKTRWELFTLDRFLEKRDSLQKTVELSAGKQELSFDLPPRPYVGKQLLVAIVRNDRGEVLNSGAWSFERDPGVRIVELTSPEKFVEDGGKVPFRVKLSGDTAGKSLDLEYIDSYRRVIGRESVPAVAEYSGVFTVKNALPSRHYRIRATLRDGEKSAIDRRETFLTVRPSDAAMAWDDYEVGTWMTGDGSRFYLWPEQARLMRKLGFRTLISNWRPLDTDFAIRYNFHPTMLHHMGLGRCAEPPDYAKSGDKRILIRKPCLSDPGFIAKTAASFDRLGKYNRQYGLRFCWMGDEQSITGYGGSPVDFCFSEHCLGEFRAFLKKKYRTLEELNRQWNTSFPAWAEVLPFTKEEVWGKHAKSVAGWADHLEFMDGRLEHAAAKFFAELKKSDPAARTSISGTQPPTAYGGMDWYRQMKHFDGLMNYNVGGQFEIQRSFQPSGEFMPWEFGYSSKGGILGAKIWRTLFLGYKGIMGFAYPSLVNPDWTLPPHMSDALGHFGTISGGLGKHWLNQLKSAPEVAVLYSQPSLRAAFFEKRKPLRGEMFIKYNALLRNCGIDFNYISNEQLENGILSNSAYRFLILPDSSALSDREVEAIRTFAAKGGKVWAEGVPGRRSDNCRPRESSPLDDLFGKGGNVLKKELDFRYLEELEYPDSPENSAGLSRLRAEMKSFVGDKNPLLLAADGKEVGDAEIFPRFGRNGEAWYGVVTDNPKMKPMTVRFAGKGHLYDGVTGKYYGYTDTATRPFSNALPALFALLPEKIGVPRVTCAGNAVSLDSGAKNDAVFRIRVFDPEGVELEHYGKNVLAPGGKARYEIPFAWSDKPGNYTVEVIEPISRLAARAQCSR